MSECYCDHEMPSVYVRETRKARKEHKCDECGSKIKPGQQYEHTFGIWDGHQDRIKTCERCVGMREFVKAHVPCFCWEHHNLYECCIDTASEYAHEAPGLLFGTYRRSIRREA
ncbi:Uncharacterised protein [Burkholderia pseudomallei]|uniref:hypothetical protein n=2 Tax=Burkholderia pseudomallei TaxID=28450 RepID=UPI0005E473D2|nr:hypothetical protein [Burkholderia pseudomallei]OMQ63517.1 hypothetical protein AQ709_13860 [Burkholderia pseudomallei]OMQ74318.1 hypothetical protein AQ711_23375 [Burkholderia pseudomallei]OMQ75048.1 hypothetical protein AQ712_25270 [Burkholderia pseudomallei]CAJ5442576.1 Uncharacterised protein [Burkholderia pseudomallei]CFK42813.1 Uncharacterised protein [Burkholderia pseudomallei]